MPVFKSVPGNAPAWCTLEFFEIINLEKGNSHTFNRMGAKEKLIILEGKCRVEAYEQAVLAKPGIKFSLKSCTGEFSVLQVLEKTKLMRVAGRWKGDCPVFGMFTPASRIPSRDKGDPVTYPKTNGMDSHYHDCDEYWIVYKGRGQAVSEGKFYEVGPGDCIATGRGHHHDFPIDHEPVKAVYLETDLEGKKRKGHLWEYKHGPVEPVLEKI